MKFFICLIIILLALGCQTTGDKPEESVEVQDVKLIFGEDYYISEDEEATDLYEEGSIFMRDGDYNMAIKFLSKAVEMDPEFIDAMDHLAISYRRAGDDESAIFWYKKSIDLAPENITAINNLALVYMYKKEYNTAVEYYLLSIKIAPEDPEGYYGLGNLLYSVGQYQKSITYMEKACMLYQEIDSPYFYDGIHILGLNYYYLEDYQNAHDLLVMLNHIYSDEVWFQELMAEIIDALPM